jgi:predicted lactoylglutathione lyase
LAGVIDHVNLSVKSLEVSRRFYEEALKPLDFKLLYVNETEALVMFGTEKNDDFGLFQSSRECSPTTSVHVAFSAKSREAVDVFYKAALLAGGTAHIPPGIRSEYHPDYYAAYVLDPDGNNIEAVNHGSKR